MFAVGAAAAGYDRYKMPIIFQNMTACKLAVYSRMGTAGAKVLLWKNTCQ